MIFMGSALVFGAEPLCSPKNAQMDSSYSRLSAARKFLHSNFKPLFTFLVSFALLLMAEDYFAGLQTAVMATAFSTSFASAFLLLLAGEKSWKIRRFKAISTLFSPFPERSLALLISFTLTFGALIWHTASANWTVYEFASLLLVFLIGGSLGIASYRALFPRKRPFASSYQIEPERYDTFAGALIVSFLLGAGLLHLPGQTDPLHKAGPVLLPLAFSMFSLLLTFLTAWIVQAVPGKKSTALSVASFASALLLIYGAERLVWFLFPPVALFNGMEMTPGQVLFAIQFGLVSGLTAGHLVTMYRLVARLYVRRMLSQPIRNPYLHLCCMVLVNVLMAYLPFAVIMTTIMLSFQFAGLYGLSLALIGLLSNVGVRLFVPGNQLHPANLSYISQLERRKFIRFTQVLQLAFVRNVRRALVRIAG